MGTSQFVTALAESVEQALEPSLRQRMPPLQQVLRAYPSSVPMFAKEGIPYFISVLGICFAREAGKIEPRSDAELRNQIIHRLSHQLSTQISGGILDLTITKITRESDKPDQIAKDRIEAKFTLQESRKEGLDLVIQLDGAEVRRFKLTFLIQIKMVIKKVLVTIKRLPPRRVESLDLRDAEADLKISDEQSRFWVELRVPIKGELNL